MMTNIRDKWLTSPERNHAVEEFQQRHNILFLTGYEVDDFKLAGERFDWSQAFADARAIFRDRMNGPW